jgi:uncharacterized GH25 family protein
MPFSGFAGTENPNSDCPKKKKILQEDTVNIYDDSENKVLEEIQLQVVPNKKPVAEKSSYKTFDNNIDDSDEVAEGNPNSAMSFNFIYYIIDKFKFTDPLE